VKPQFEYHLEHHGHLRALEYDLHSAAETVLFEGWWYTFVNQQDIQRERLHRTPTVEFGNFQIVTFSALQQQIRALEYWGEHPDSPERFKAYVAFMEELKTRPSFPSRSDMRRD
jgi:hypothetical protein